MSAHEQVYLYTIGYQGKSIQDFLRELRNAKVHTVVDVRATPVSRRPCFSKTALMEALEDEGIQYLGVPELGAAKSLREMYRDADFGEFARAYQRTVLADRQQTFSELAEIVVSQAVCLLCYEADSADCHRSILSAVLERTIRGNANVIHL